MLEEVSGTRKGWTEPKISLQRNSAAGPLAPDKQTWHSTKPGEDLKSREITPDRQNQRAKSKTIFTPPAIEP